MGQNALPEALLLLWNIVLRVSRQVAQGPYANLTDVLRRRLSFSSERYLHKYESFQWAWYTVRTTGSTCVVSRDFHASASATSLQLHLRPRTFESFFRRKLCSAHI